MNKNVVKPGDNIFGVLGFEKEEAQNLKLRSMLMIEIARFIQQNELSLGKAGSFFGMQHSRVNDLLKGKIDKFTIDYLVNLVAKTGKKVSIRICDASGER